LTPRGRQRRIRGFSEFETEIRLVGIGLFQEERASKGWREKGNQGGRRFGGLAIQALSEFEIH